MPQLIQNGDVLSGTSNDSANILYSEPDGSSKNVQDKIEELNNSLNVINNNLTATDSTKFRFATDGEGNYGYLKADDSFVPFKGGAVELHSKVYISGTLSDTYTFTEDYEKILVFASSANDTISNVQFSLVPTIQGTATTLMSYNNSSGGGIAGYASVLLLENVKANDTISFSGRYCSLWTIYQI